MSIPIRMTSQERRTTLKDASLMLKSHKQSLTRASHLAKAKTNMVLPITEAGKVRRRKARRERSKIN